MIAKFWPGFGIAVLAVVCGAGTGAFLLAPALTLHRDGKTALRAPNGQQPTLTDRGSTYSELVTGPTLKRLPEADVGRATMADRWAPFGNVAADSGLTDSNTALLDSHPDKDSRAELTKTDATANAVVPLPRPRPAKANIAASLDPSLPRPRSAGSAPPSLFTAVSVGDDRYPQP